MLLAASTQRTVGFIILAIVAIGTIVFLYFNIRAARAEVGSEIELAPNRSEPLTDENLEGRRLDLNLGAALVMLTMIGVMLPVYWLGEPGRHEGRVEDTARIFTNRGEELYTEGAQCINCHGAAGVGGAVSTALTDESGGFVAQVNWKAPALNSVLSRYSEDEVLHVLNFGRNGVMPAWGAPGGGPLTSQQLEEIVFYIRSIQIDGTAIMDAVTAGVRVDMATYLRESADDPRAADVQAALEAEAEAQAALDEAVSAAEAAADTDESATPGQDPAVVAAREELQAATDAVGAAVETATDDMLAAVDEVVETARELALDADEELAEAVDDAASEGDIDAAEDQVRRAALELLSVPGEVPDQELYWEYGGFLFSNSAAGGTYGCARCHTAGWSYDGAADFTIDENGREGPLPQFADGYADGCGFFGPNLCAGSTLNQFDSASSHSDFICIGQTIGQTYGNGGSGGNGQMPGFCERTDDDLEVTYPATLTQAQIDAIVAYERNL